MSEVSTIIFNVDLKKTFAEYSQDVQRVIDLVVYAYSSEFNQTRKLGDASSIMGGIYPSPTTALTPDNAKPIFIQWSLTNGFRDLVESTNLLLLHVRAPIANIEEFHDSLLNGRSEEECNSRYESSWNKFHNEGLPEKIKWFELNHPGVLSPLVSKIASLNKARNCLVHRFGTVALRDCNVTDKLVVEWDYMVGNIEAPDGKLYKANLADVVDLGDSVPGEFVANLRREGRFREYRLGESVSFTLEEFREVCFTFMIFAEETLKNLGDYLANHKVPQLFPNSTRTVHE